MPRTDPLGDRCKRFESAEADRRALPGIPLLCRLDGRAEPATTFPAETP